MDDESNQTDEQIASLVQSGKVELFGILITRYQKKMERYASKVLNDYNDRQDVVQEIFTKAYVNIQSFDTSRKFSSWLYRIAHNEIVNVFKKNKKRKFLPLFDLDIFFPQYAVRDTNINQQIERQEIKAVLDKCLNQLDEKYKEPLALYYFEDLSYEEIADVLQIPSATVGVRIRRAKGMLKSILEQQKNYMQSI